MNILEFNTKLFVACIPLLRLQLQYVRSFYPQKTPKPKRIIGIEEVNIQG